MVFTQHGRVEGLDEYGDEAKNAKYIDCYIPFFDSFRDVGIPFDLESNGVPGRKVDRALLQFGQAISIPASNVLKRQSGGYLGGPSRTAITIPLRDAHRVVQLFLVSCRRAQST